MIFSFRLIHFCPCQLFCPSWDLNNIFPYNRSFSHILSRSHNHTWLLEHITTESCTPICFQVSWTAILTDIFTLKALDNFQVDPNLTRSPKLVLLFCLSSESRYVLPNSILSLSLWQFTLQICQQELHDRLLCIQYLPDHWVRFHIHCSPTNILHTYRAFYSA